jgi:hypothetical protein
MKVYDIVFWLSSLGYDLFKSTFLASAYRNVESHEKPQPGYKFMVFLG